VQVCTLLPEACNMRANGCASTDAARLVQERGVTAMYKQGRSGSGLVFGGMGLCLLFAHGAALAADANWQVPMTPWGEPDLRGMWPLNHLIGVPVVRPKEFGDRLYMTEEEFEAKQAAVAARDNRFQTGPIPQADARSEEHTSELQ